MHLTAENIELYETESGKKRPRAQRQLVERNFAFLAMSFFSLIEGSSQRSSCLTLSSAFALVQHDGSRVRVNGDLKERKSKKKKNLRS